MSGSQTLDELLERAREGGAHDVRRFLVAARSRLFRWALVRTGSLDEAEDLTQEGLLKVSEKLDRFDGRARCSTWLFSVLNHTHLDGLRRTNSRRRAEMRAAELEPLEVGPWIRDDELSHRVRRFLGGLSERQREVVNLVDLEGYTPTEVAGMTGLESSTVRVHLHRGRRALRDALEEEMEP